MSKVFSPAVYKFCRALTPKTLYLLLTVSLLCVSACLLSFKYLGDVPLRDGSWCLVQLVSKTHWTTHCASLLCQQSSCASSHVPVSFKSCLVVSIQFYLGLNSFRFVIFSFQQAYVMTVVSALYHHPSTRPSRSSFLDSKFQFLQSGLLLDLLISDFIPREMPSSLSVAETRHSVLFSTVSVV